MSFKGVKYSIDGMGSYLAPCYSFLYYNHIAEKDKSEIKDVTVYPPAPLLLSMKKNIKPYIKILNKSIFKDIWKSSGITEDDFSFTFDIHKTNITYVLVVGTLFRMTWEQPEIVDRIIRWHQKGYSPDESFILGHYLMLNRVGTHLANTNHLLFLTKIKLKGLIANYKKLLDWIQKNKNVIGEKSEIMTPIRTPIRVMEQFLPTNNQTLSSFYKRSLSPINRSQVYIEEKSIKIICELINE